MPTVLQKLNLAVVGACRRGAAFKAGLAACPEVRLHAVCDLDPEGLDEAAASFGAAEKYTDYEQLLSSPDLDAVIVATPMHLHATQATMALQRGLHVLSEVTAAVSVDECRQLVAATKASAGTYMLAENCNYFLTNVVVRELVRRGLLGTPYYAEAEYLHNVVDLAEKTTWRRHWALGVDGITYGTHSLGPVLSWMAGDRVTRVCCAGSGHHYQDPRGDEYHQDTHVMLCQMASGGLVKIRVDMVSERPYVTCTYQLQGTEGVYESARSRDDLHRVWLRSLSPDAETWLDLKELQDQYLPEGWAEGLERSKGSGHGGSDYFVVLAFLQAALGRRPPDIDVHAAMDMTLPGLISQESMQRGGAWVDVPDSREW